MSLIDRNMNGKLTSGQEHHQEENKNVRETSPGVKDAQKQNTDIKEESEDELYGLALILRNTEDAAQTGCDVYQTKNQKNDQEKSTSDLSEQEEDHKPQARCCPNLNRRLVINKSFYFFFFSAVGSLFPYLAVFYKQLWLSAHETGILIGIRPLIQVFGTPLWGAAADTYKKSKLIFIMSLVAWLVSNYSLSLVSPVFHLGDCKDNATMGIVQEIIEELENTTINEKNSTHHKQTAASGQMKPPAAAGNQSRSNHWFEIKKVKQENASKRKTTELPKQKLIQNQVNKAFLNDDSKNIFYNASYEYLKTKRGSKNRNLNKSSRINSSTVAKERHRRQMKNVVVSLKTSLNDQLMKRDMAVLIKARTYLNMPNLQSNKQRRMTINNNAEISQSELLKLLHNSSDIDIDEFFRKLNREHLERVFDSLNMAGEYPWPLDTVADYDLTQKSNDWRTPHDSHLFTILFVITTIGTIIAAPAITLADTATLQNLGNKPEDYGKQRLWGAFGWGLTAFIVGSSLSTIEEISNCNNPLSVDYLPCFYAFACLMGVALLIGTLFEFDEKTSHETNIWQGLSVLFDIRYMYFIFTVLFCGSALGFIETFLFWHLQDLGGTQFLFSTITAIHCISEVVVYCWSGMLIRWLGHHQVLYIGLSCYIIRFFAYALISNSWVVLPFEILHGLSTAAVWSAAVVFVGLIPGAPATMQGILGGVHWGLGNGGGGVIGGLLITYAGTTNSFFIFGIVTLVDLSLFIFLNNMDFFTCFEWSKGNGTRSNYTLQEEKAEEHEELEEHYDDLY